MIYEFLNSFYSYSLSLLLPSISSFSSCLKEHIPAFPIFYLKKKKKTIILNIVVLLALTNRELVWIGNLDWSFKILVLSCVMNEIFVILVKISKVDSI